MSSPISSPVVPVITPAERSNSPPIISSATATAMIPSVEATSVQFAMPLSVPNASVVTQKNAQTTSAPSSEPTSGRRMQARPEADVRQALVRDRVGRGSGTRGRRGHRVPASASFWTVAALSLVTKPGPVSTGWPPPTVFALLL